MNVLAILRDAWFFYSRHFLTIVRLCLPLILLESATRLALDHWLGENVLPALDLLVGLIFYPLYVGALILYLDARSRGHDPALRAVYARALPLWPALAVLSGLGSLRIMLGAHPQRRLQQCRCVVVQAVQTGLAWAHAGLRRLISF